jgi:hypothetical protein
MRAQLTIIVNKKESKAGHERLSGLNSPVADGLEVGSQVRLSPHFHAFLFSDRSYWTTETTQPLVDGSCQVCITNDNWLFTHDFTVEVFYVW